MKVRAKANGNVLDLPDGEAEALVKAGIYERMDDEPSVTKDVSAQKSGAKYKRKDMKAEE